MEAIAARVRDLAGATRHTPNSLGRALKIPASSASNYWSGKRAWPTETLHLLADELCTTIDYLLGRTPDSGVLEFRGSPSQFDELVRLRDGDPALARHPAASNDDDIVEIAEIDLQYGLGGAFVDENAVESEPRHFSREWLRKITDSPPSMLFWARGRGNSMAPTIEEGEIVLGDRSQTSPRDDDLIWACVLGEIGMIKRLRVRPDHVKILSDNPLVQEDVAYPDDDLRVVGRIVTVLKNI